MSFVLCRGLRPYPISPYRVVPPHIDRPDWAVDVRVFFFLFYFLMFSSGFYLLFILAKFDHKFSGVSTTFDPCIVHWLFISHLFLSCYIANECFLFPLNLPLFLFHGHNVVLMHLSSLTIIRRESLRLNPAVICSMLWR